MTEPLEPSELEKRLADLNKKILEIKKRIQLSEGQRKANFEQCDTKKQGNVEKIVTLKKEIKDLLAEYTSAKNNDETAERINQASRESSAQLRKRKYEEAIQTVDEDNIRLRKKLDLVRYKSDKQKCKLANLLREYEELMTGTLQRIAEKKLDEPMKKKTISLENHLHRMNVMQMEADTVRKKYRSVRSSLKADAAFFASSLTNLDENIKDQENEIKRLKAVKEEAIQLRDATLETLTNEEIEAVNTSKERECIIQDFRQRVEERKMQLEQLERMIFPITPAPQKDLAVGEHKEDADDSHIDKEKEELDRLEEIFAKLRNATGVTRTEDLLNRFLGQRVTRESLQKMKLTTEDEKMNLEKTKQQLTAEIEMQKFSEAKEAEQNAEEVEKINQLIREQRFRQEKATIEKQRIQELVNFIVRELWKFCDLLRDSGDSLVPDGSTDISKPLQILELLEDKMNSAIGELGGWDKYIELLVDAVIEKLDTTSIETESADEKVTRVEEPRLFRKFPTMTVASTQPAPPSEDEEEVPSRQAVKRQAQLLIDTKKNRRKGFHVRR